MCGITGAMGPASSDVETVQRMTAALRHRGPDDCGVWTDQASEIAFGHRRLSIVDLSPNGHQPMASADGRFVITYNGEIYNHVEIRAQLEAAGLAPEKGWRGHSDTETLLQAVTSWGLEQAIARCTGMYALAVWDRAQRKLSLARDRFGEKPLYYGWIGGSFLFASELKALRAHPKFDNDIDRVALRPFAARGYIPAPRSVYRRIFKLPPGCILDALPDICRTPLDEPPEIGTATGGLFLRRYWDYSELVRRGLDDPISDQNEAIELLEGALRSAIRRQAVADVPVGAFLSGGIDSSTIVAIFQKYSQSPVHSYTIGFENPEFNEAPQAKAVAQALGTVHHEQYVRVEEAQEVIPLLPAMYDEPFADSSQIPTFLVSRFAREQVTVALTGDGGDELFAGYRRHFVGDQIWRRLRHIPFRLRSPSARALAKLPTSFWTSFAHLAGKRGNHWGGVLQDLLRSAGAAATFDDFYLTFLDEWAFDQSPVLGRADETRPMPLDVGGPAPDASRAMYCDAMAYLPDDILCKVDRASMAVSLETRVPFLDQDVAELAARIPLRMKVQGGTGKKILRQLLARHLPRELFERPKAGFSIPIGEWLQGSLRPWAEELLQPDRLRQDGWFDAGAVTARWNAHLQGVRDYSPSLWSILMFQAWHRDQLRSTQPAIVPEVSHPPMKFVGGTI